MSHPKLSEVVNAVFDTRAQMRIDGASAKELADVTERIVRHYWAPYVRPLHEWPVYDTLPKCAYCDGTGLVLRFNVVNRLGASITEGSPCRCPKGARFYPPERRSEDFTSAGKVPKPFTRAGR